MSLDEFALKLRFLPPYMLMYGVPGRCGVSMMGEMIQYNYFRLCMHWLTLVALNEWIISEAVDLRVATTHEFLYAATDVIKCNLLTSTAEWQLSPSWGYGAHYGIPIKNHE